jgi:sterol desaturase/sphingolipid hydroxylase (fatty acid hydroxylase superfamily)
MSAPLSLQIFIGFFMFALVFMPLEHRFPQKGGGTFRAGWLIDVTYYVVGCFVGRVTDALSVGGMLLIRHAAGWKSAHMAAAQPGWLQFFEILLLADFLAYLFHRALHRNPYLWQLHKIHHSSERMDWLANVRLHPLDKVLGDCFQFIPIFLLGFGDGPMLAYTIFLGFQGFLNHSNVKLDYGPLRWVIASPQFHHWHHCNHPEAYDKNFSPHLVIFDLLFGTANIAPPRVLPDVYGVPETVPQGFLGQMVFPFRGGKRDVLD